MKPYYQDDLKAPFPYFGGKRNAAPIVWEALGDVGGYVEPFAGSAAVLLRRPPFEGRRVETLNDSDGWLINAWRAIQHDPVTVAREAFGPVSEVDYHARLAWLSERRSPDLVAWLEGDPLAYDARAAAWWLYVTACAICAPFSGGPWRVIDGLLTNTSGTPGRVSAGIRREIPHLGNAGQGIHRELPHLGDAGQGALEAYLGRLQTRLARVRITAGDWKRVVKPSVLRATATRSEIGVFLDPPYETSSDLYAAGKEAEGISAEVREWVKNADPNLRIVLAGYENEHDALLDHGWTVTAGKAGGGAGYNKDGDAGKRERLWMSPSCLNPHEMLDLWGGGAA